MQDQERLLASALLEALDQDEEVGFRARGDDAAHPPFFLRELAPPASTAALPPPISIPSGAGRSAARSQNTTERLATEVASDHIRCPRCNTENARASRFCASCGAALHQFVRAEPGMSGFTGSHRNAISVPVTLISINEDGTDGSRIELQFAESVVGRAGDIRFPTDAFLSPKHARIAVEDSSVFIEDLYSLNGTFMKLREEVRLTPGDTFLMGRQVLRFEKFEHQIAPKARASDGTRYMGSPPPTGHFKISQIGIGGVAQNVYCIHDSGAVIGREKGDVIFPRDKFMSGRHAHIYPREDGHFYLADLGSSNGTWIKIWERREMRPGDFMFLGQQLFRIEF
jgi:hypothetical protein